MYTHSKQSPKQPTHTHKKHTDTFHKLSTNLPSNRHTPIKSIPTHPTGYRPVSQATEVAARRAPVTLGSTVRCAGSLGALSYDSGVVSNFTRSMGGLLPSSSEKIVQNSSSRSWASSIRSDPTRPNPNPNPTHTHKDGSVCFMGVLPLAVLGCPK